jgi:hypothetical protein
MSSFTPDDAADYPLGPPPTCACGNPLISTQRRCADCDRLRDEIAGTLLPALVQDDSTGDKSLVTDEAYRWADSMLKSKRKENL